MFWYIKEMLLVKYVEHFGGEWLVSRELQNLLQLHFGLILELLYMFSYALCPIF